MTVQELRERMSVSELRGWVAYYEVKKDMEERERIAAEAKARAKQSLQQ